MKTCDEGKSSANSSNVFNYVRPLIMIVAAAHKGVQTEEDRCSRCARIVVEVSRPILTLVE
eukprot:scaffold1567_cov161-Amphora_coffeaeformis.AAC.2